MQLEGRRILLTGATRGIGRALAEQLVAEGAVVLAVARAQSALDALAQALGPTLVPIRCDLALTEARSELIEQLLTDHAPLGGIINNAGTQSETDFLTDPPDRVLQVLITEIAVNLTAPLHLSIALLPHLAQRPEGFVLNIGSSLALSPKRAAPIYCATKAGLRNFTKGLRYQAEAGAKSEAGNVKVIDAIMALVDTDMTQGRGRGKISPDRAAREVLEGLKRGKREIWVGKAKFLRVIDRIAPGLTARILR